MFRFRQLAATLAPLGAVAVLIAFNPVAVAQQKVDLIDLREAVDAAAKRGDNVDEIRKALDAFEKAVPNIKAGEVPPELQKLRDAVDFAASKGENVEEIARQLATVEMAVAGKSLAKPKPEPKPEPPPRPVRPGLPQPGFPVFPVPQPGLPGAAGIDAELFTKAMELRKQALDLLVQNPDDPEVKQKVLKLQAEANELMLKAMRGMAGPGINLPVMPGFPDVPFPDGRPANRPRLGIRMEQMTPILAEQLGLDPGVGIVVADVTPDSVAEKVGLKPNDIIIEFAGKPVSDDTNDFVRRVTDVKNGAKVDIVVLRKGKKVEIKGVELPDAGAPGKPIPIKPLPIKPPPLPPGVRPELPLPLPPLPNFDPPKAQPIPPPPPAPPAVQPVEPKLIPLPAPPTPAAPPK